MKPAKAMPMAVLVIDRARHPDRLMRRAEMGVAANLHRNFAAQAAEGGQVLALGRFGQFPPDMELRRALGRPPAAFDDQHRRAEVAGDMVQLGRDVTGVQIDDDGLHLKHVGGAGLTLFGDGAGDDVDGRAFAVRPSGEGCKLLGRGVVGRDPDVVRLAVPALPSRFSCDFSITSLAHFDAVGERAASTPSPPCAACRFTTRRLSFIYKSIH